MVTPEPRFKLPSQLSLDDTFFAQVAHLGVDTITVRDLLDKFIDIAPACLGENAHPATVGAVKMLDWHARELQTQLNAAKGTPMADALEVALDSLEATAAILKCLEVR